MLRYVVDAYAWIEYLIGSEAGSEVNIILENESNEIYTCAVTVAEVISKVSREGRDTEVAYDVLVNNSQVIDVDEELSKETGLLHSNMRKTEKDFGLADAYVLATARKLKSKVLTGDKHFRHVKEAVLLK
jgi:predicted nucleic acid-binding protein